MNHGNHACGVNGCPVCAAALLEDPPPNPAMKDREWPWCDGECGQKARFLLLHKVIGTACAHMLCKDCYEKGLPDEDHVVHVLDKIEITSAGACVRCRKTRHKDRSPVRWRCAMCFEYVCRGCTLTIPGKSEYYELTLCSTACWEKAGRPED